MEVDCCYFESDILLWFFLFVHFVCTWVVEKVQGLTQKQKQHATTWKNYFMR